MRAGEGPLKSKGNFSGSLVAKSCLILYDPMDCSTPGFIILHYLPVHWASKLIPENWSREVREAPFSRK